MVIRIFASFHNTHERNNNRIFPEMRRDEREVKNALSRAREKNRNERQLLLLFLFLLLEEALFVSHFLSLSLSLSLLANK